jgi:hypothetical protein
MDSVAYIPLLDWTAAINYVHIVLCYAICGHVISILCISIVGFGFHLINTSLEITCNFSLLFLLIQFCM